MIPGIAAQVATILPRGVLAPRLCYVDDDNPLPSFIAFDAVVTQLVSSTFAIDADSFFSPRLPQVLNPGLVASGESIIAPAVRGDRVLAPMLYFDGEVLSLPSIGIPGFLQANLFAADDTIFAPFVFGPGSLRPALLNALDAFFAPIVTAPLTLRPNQYADSDSFMAPIVRQGFLLPSLVNDIDAIFAPTRTSPTVLGGIFVIDADVNYAPAVGRILGASLLAVDDVIYQPSETGGSKIIAPDLLSDLVDQEAFYVISISGTPASFDGASNAVTLSPNNLTATRSSTVANAGARSTAQKTAGKYYFEVTMTTTHGDSDCCGLLSSTGSYNNMIGGLQCTVVYRLNGTIFSNSANSAKALGTCTAGDIISVAVDLAARKAWFRKNGGNWNGLVLTSENPNTGIGGVTVQASSSMAPAVGFGGANGAINDAMTANFGGTPSGTPFAYTPPVGFAIWTT